MVRLHVYSIIIVFPKDGSAKLPMFDKKLCNICYPICINMYKYILNMYMYIIHMHCTVCKERPLLLRADAFPIRLMDLVCNLPKRQLKFLTDIRGNSNYIITV